MNIRRSLAPCGAILFLAGACLLHTAAIAQTSVKLFDATPVTFSGTPIDPSLATAFGSRTLLLACPAAPTGRVASTGDGNGSLVVDNFLTVNGANVCSGQSDTGNFGNTSLSCFNAFWGNTGDALTSFAPVSPIDISARLQPGRQLVSFEMMDWGGFAGSSELWLVTNCSAPAQVPICHQRGTSEQRSLVVAQSAVPAHIAHGDTLGACP